MIKTSGRTRGPEGFYLDQRAGGPEGFIWAREPEDRRVLFGPEGQRAGGLLFGPEGQRTGGFYLDRRIQISGSESLLLTKINPENLGPRSLPEV